MYSIIYLDIEDDEYETTNLGGSTILVCWASLLLLLTKCRREGCASMVCPSNMKLSVKGYFFCYLLIFCTFLITGAAINVKMVCNDGHCENWCSSETVGSGRKMLYLINISMIVYSFLSGIHFEKIKVGLLHCIDMIVQCKYFQSFFTLLHVPQVSASTFYRYLKRVVYPVTYCYWLQQQAEIITDMKVNK